jgi:hypothetical protein
MFGAGGKRILCQFPQWVEGERSHRYTPDMLDRMRRSWKKAVGTAASATEEPTPKRRLLTATVAGLLAFFLTEGGLRLLPGPGGEWGFFGAFASAGAAATAAATTRVGRSVVFGCLAAFRLLLALTAAAVGALAASIG